ncbi:kinetochore and Eb1-associated basic protein [Ceratitis capitata]|uniref:kinetochore and Eb1-associated basic protein n=1 Tax=Ceratitis capitata TaxID=7213 RepID=UPI00032A0A04|nr:kinetochore and Eb1-associated basic protein [Ceratitis capitata]
MQHPRRTSEFHDDIGTATKRNSRSTQSRPSRIARPHSMERQNAGLPSSAPRGSRTTPQKSLQVNGVTDAPGTANKYSSRTSRIARPSSMERQTLGLQSSALRGTRTTPQKTPTSNSKITRVLFTAEKQRNAHNDKRWVQERAQQISEYLRETAKPGAVHGLPSEFFARSGCLRQMSTKQFVAIVNHFLHFIWGTRFTVGSNYVDDIINIMQKLQYPHQINKSWLKTPNTTHSFGFVIELFDFFMDFVPPKNEEEAIEMEFEFQDPEHLNQNSLMQESPDAEFTALVLQNSEEGFKLWDKQLEDELFNLQQQTCDVLIYKRCGIQDVTSLDAHLDELRNELSDVRKKRPHISEEDEERCLRFKNELRETRQQLDIAQETLEVTTKKLSELQTERQECKSDFMQMLEKVEEIKSSLAKQTISSEQRDTYIQELEQRKYTLQCMERTLRDVEGRQHHQQVLVSRHKKQLTDQISKYNDHIRAISCTKLACDAGALQLPLHPQIEDVNECLKLLEKTRAAKQHKQQQAMQQEQELEKQAQELNHNIISSLRPKCAELETALKHAERNSKEFAKKMHKQSSAMKAQLQELEAHLQQLEVDYKSLQNTKHEKQMLLEKFEKQNEELMNRAEAEYKAAADEREASLNEYEKKLEQANAILVEFADEIEKRDLLLKRIEEEKVKE